MSDEGVRKTDSAIPSSSYTKETFLLRSGARSGLKREFAFALKAQTEISINSTGRTRSGKIHRPSSSSRDETRSLNDAENGAEVLGGMTTDDDEFTENQIEMRSNGCLYTGVKKDEVPDVEMEIVNNVELGERLIDNVSVAEARVLADEHNLNTNLANIGIQNKQIDEQTRVYTNGIASSAVSVNRLNKHLDADLPEIMSTILNGKLDKKSSISTTTKNYPYVDPSSMVANSDCSDGLDEVRGREFTIENPNSARLKIIPPKKMGMKMSKSINLTKIPSNVKELLGTGLLEGLAVKYIASIKKKDKALRGVIKDGGILCLCSSCNGTNIFTAYRFEVHSGSTKKHPSDYIFLDNGKCLHDVLRACTNVPLDLLESTIQNAIGSAKSIRVSSRVPLDTSESTVDTCKRCNELYQPSPNGVLSSICDKCLALKLNKPSSFIPHKNTRLLKSSLSPDSSKSVISEKKSVHGKITTKDTWLHKLVFMNDTLLDGTEVAYYARGQRLLEGYIKEGGIFCNCCNNVVSPSQFESHAGWAKRRKPYLNIYTSNGVSLHELAVSLSKDKKFTGRQNDKLCRICSDTGDLILCDVCPRAYHKECVGLSSTPTGDWYCPCCEAMHHREKYVAHNENAIAAGRVSGVDSIEQIFKRCIRIVQSADTDASSCVLCRCHDFSNSEFGPRTVILCDQCEKEFHIGCLKEHKIADLKELPEENWFCCPCCSETHTALQKLLLSGSSQPLPEVLLENIKKKYVEKDLDIETGLDVRWSLLNGKVASPDCRLVLAKVISIFHETFNPIIDLFTGEDLIPAMVYGRNMRDQDFGGMYCLVLTVNSIVVSAGILRVLGVDAAELPLAATTKESQGLGYFQSLFSCMETLLLSLNVKNIVLPATKEAEEIWVKKFGFREISPLQLEACTKGSRTMKFQDTPMLHKSLSNPQKPGNKEKN